MNKAHLILKHHKKNAEEDRANRLSMLWGLLYLILGLMGILISIFSVAYNLENIVTQSANLIAGAFTGILSVLIILYGYRIMKKNYTPFI